MSAIQAQFCQKLLGMLEEQELAIHRCMLIVQQLQKENEAMRNETTATPQIPRDPN